MPVEQIATIGPRSLVAWGDVVDTSPDVTVRIAGGARNAVVKMALANYTPTSGDRVALLRVGVGFWVILGKVASI